MSPRGSAFLALSERLQERLRPINAGWYAGADVHTSYYGPPLRLATDARRFDVSPAWFSWVGTAPVLELLEQIGVEAIRAYDVALANRFRAGLGLPPGGSAIVSTTVPVPQPSWNGPASGPQSAPVRCGPRSTSTRPRPTSTRPWTRWSARRHSPGCHRTQRRIREREVSGGGAAERIAGDDAHREVAATRVEAGAG